MLGFHLDNNTRTSIPNDIVGEIYKHDLHNLPGFDEDGKIADDFEAIMNAVTSHIYSGLSPLQENLTEEELDELWGLYKHGLAYKAYYGNLLFRRMELESKLLDEEI